jgi:hypothetical protein
VPASTLALFPPKENKPGFNLAKFAAMEIDNKIAEVKAK